MADDVRQRIVSLLKGACVLGAGWYIFSFLAIALFSIHYPYHLEWMEGQTLDVVRRILDGKSIYVEPTIEYVPFIYPPLYFYVSALSAKIFGMDFFAARLVSLLSAVGTGFILYHWVRKEEGGKAAALIAAGLYFSTYLLSARWFDVARIDSLYMFLVACALFVFVHYHDRAASIASGLLFAAAFFTKQNALIVAAPILVWGLFMQRNHTLIATIIFGLTVLAGITAANIATGGWFSFYVFDVPASHRIDERYILDFWFHDLLPNLWPLLLVVLAGAVELLRTDRARLLRYLAVAAGLIGAAYAGRLHRYGWTNVLMPAHFCLALCAALSLTLWHHKKIMQCACLALVALQMALLLYNPVLEIPDADDKRKGDAFMQEIAAIKGDVFMPGLQFVPTRIGKTSYSYGFAAIDVLLARPKKRDYVRDKLKKELAEALQQRRFSAIVTTYMTDREQMERYYNTEGTLEYPRMVAGYQPRPAWLLVPDGKGPHE